jgi:ABC-2 type transport system ATP-binding protein
MPTADTVGEAGRPTGPGMDPLRPVAWGGIVAGMSDVIETEGLTRTFGARAAVDHLDLTVERGEVFGLLGPNGAGKTTTIRMLTTLLVQTSGSARVCGFDISSRPREVRRRIGYVQQTIPWQVNSLLSPREVLEVEASLHHVSRGERRTFVDEALELVGLAEHADRLIKELSGGMHKRLDLASGLLHRPELLILDEPTLGLDVQSRHRIWEYVDRLTHQGVTVLLATNYLDEADRLCDRLMIVDHGRTVVTGSPGDLKRQIGADVIQVATAAPDSFRSAIAEAPWVKRVVDSATTEIHVYVEDAALALPEVMRISIDNGIVLDRLTYAQPTLDDVFLLHTGRELRDLEMTG